MVKCRVPTCNKEATEGIMCFKCDELHWEAQDELMQERKEAREQEDGYYD